MPRQPETSNTQPICPVSAQSETGASRTKVAYWRSRVQKVKSKRGSESPDYSARIVFKSRRVRFPLHTSNKDAAASKAAKIFSFLLENGWDETIQEFKSKGTKQEPAVESGTASTRNTIGDLILANHKYSSARPQTLQAYFKALRRIVSGLVELSDDMSLPAKKDSRQIWRESVDATPLDLLTPERIQEWKRDYLAKNSKTATGKRKATTTVNSLIRNSKALFSKKLLPFISKDIELPAILPFEGVTMEKPPSPRYHSKIDAKEIIKTAHAELREDNPEAYKIFLLALICGLRVSEIDFLLWEAFDFRTGILTIENTEYHELKSEDSAGEINLSEDLQSIFLNFSKSTEGEFVIQSGASIERPASARTYRSKTHINVLIGWLRKNGVRAPKPIHELRKEIGSIIASEEGIFAASRYLRHSDIRITSAIYADQKKAIIPSVGKDFLS
ncbi:tyrosine-type recombinase/integrase [Akkermansiaceae bacterium]|jgi:integrase|nr:tyrosine-type recombinase/integrase [Akkermansiaceae bacterium]MDA7896477.1 tyrosine-type recombinase/integrase [bacterium]MDA7907337.1 tyrosine-type recombinase/integrase [Akkermansiaceae bacterium]MDA7929548.1 tyrosine-type recombinase/integrase [Akkermansiaceae bacterium]MDA7934330.1 tyrosine-type recombinase/integrase [Akkermansiaceae bacterium]